MKRSMALAATALLLAGCGAADSEREMKQMTNIFDDAVRELSSEKYWGRNEYEQGEKRAGLYLAESFVRITGESGFATEPEFQPFEFRLNLMWGDAKFAVDGKPFEFATEFSYREFSSTFHGTMPIIYALEEEIYNRETFRQTIEALPGAEKSFVVLDFNLFSKLWSGILPQLHPGDDLQLYDGETYEEFLKGLKVGGVIFRYSDNISYGKARSGYQVGFPVVCVKSDFPLDAKEATADIDVQMQSDHQSDNICAWIKGTDAPEGELYGEEGYYVILAHYDHHGLQGAGNYYAGANDNASGSAALLALADYFVKNRPSHSILFLWVGAEESNLLGSKYYVLNPLYPLDKIRMLLNLDMIGDTADLLSCCSTAPADDELEKIRKRAVESGAFNSTKKVKLNDNSDHYYFSFRDVPALYFETTGENIVYYHTPFDTYEHFSTEGFEHLMPILLEWFEEDDKR